MSDIAARIAALSPERQALLAARLRSPGEVSEARREALAIVGIGCRFPGGVDSPQRFWSLLRDGIDPIIEVPADRWDVDAFYAEDPSAPGKMITRWGGFLPELDRFEPSFFGISPRETASLDPQQRVVLEVAWEALEDAGEVPAHLGGSRTGVYVGTHTNDYSWMLFTDARGLDTYASTGTARSIVANRLSYAFDLRGPSVAVDTACSASLVAVHLACQALRARECDLALAGGVNLLMSPLWSVALSKLGILAPDGRCKTFDASANGIVRSEGCGIIVLKRLTDALANGDRVWAIIRGSATNQDGRSNGLTAPNGLAQQAVVRQALADGGVRPDEVGLVETHGTGTPLGDPIEVEALASVIGTGEYPCLLGAVKTNIGHCEGAAGIAGLIKVALALQHEAVPGLVHFRGLNPQINLAGTRFRIPCSLEAWPRGDRRRVAGVSAFGFGGSNAHVVLEEGPARAADPAATSARARLLPLSARSGEGLRSLASAYAQQLGDEGHHVDVGDLCATAALRRIHYPYRRAVVGASRQSLMARLAEAAETSAPAASGTGGIAFVFSGQGTQWTGMAHDLLLGQPVFRAVAEACDEQVRIESGWSVIDVLEARDETVLTRTEFAQPAIFVVQVGLAALLAAWGVVPTVVTGHSVGEIAAAHVAGALTLADAMRVVIQRAHLMQRTEGQGRMVSVELPEADARRAIAAEGDRLAIAAVNAPGTTVLAGDVASLAIVVDELEQRHVTCQWLAVNYAFHSPQMEPLRTPLVGALSGLTSATPRIPLVSTVTGEVVSGGELNAAYWGRNLREPVRLAAAIDTTTTFDISTFVELGPHPVLGGALARTLEVRGRRGCVLASLRRGQADDAAMLGLVGRLWERGHRVDWAALNAGPRSWVSVPPTPWERESHPPRLGPTVEVAAAPAAAASGHPLLARRLQTAQPTYETRLDREAPAYLADHRIDGVAIVPATSLIEMALQAGTEALGTEQVRLEDLVIRCPLPLDGPRVVQVTVAADTREIGLVRIFSKTEPGDASGWILHATAQVRVAEARPDHSDLDTRSARALLRARATVIRDGDVHYEDLRRRGAEFGPAFRGVRRLWYEGNEALAEVELPLVLADAGIRTRLHPALVDACLQMVEYAAETDEAALLVPLAADSIRIHATGSRAWSYARVRRHGDDVRADFVVTDDDGGLLAELHNVVLRPAPSGTASGGMLHEVTWRRQPLSAGPGGVDAGRWMILADRGGVADGLARRLESHGHATMLIRDGDSLPPPSAASWNGVIHLRSLDVAVAEDGDGDALPAAVVGATASALELVQGLDASMEATRLWLVTRDAQAIGIPAPGLAIAQSALWGLGRTLALERPELRPTLVDLDHDQASAEAFVAELLAGDDEPQVAFRAGLRYVARLARLAEPAVATWPAGPLRLEASPRGVLDNLAWIPTSHTTPGRGEVAVEVEAIGLNFRDVLNALDMYPGDAGALGSEFAGRVTACGPGVETPTIGQRVMGVGAGTFATSVVTNAALVVPVPASLATEAAATIPIAFLTAYWALQGLAGLRPGQRVLIHSAAGGVGLAAVALAQQAGGEVFATAGSPEKRALLTSLGVQHVMDSRSVDFVQTIHALTDGDGVDIVLNSLTGDFIPASMQVTRRGGCFVEIGRRGIWDAGRMAAVRPDLAYHVLYLGDMFEREPERVQAMLRTLVIAFSDGQLAPLPYRVYPAARAADAFRLMAQAGHVGKLVVTPPGRTATPGIRADATYLITGGLGPLGLSMAEWLATRGARHVVLMGRSAPTPAATDRVRGLELKGVMVRVTHGDVARAEDVDSVLAEIARTLPPLRGIVHAAGTLADAAVSGQSRTLLDTAMAPKVAGAWNLHTGCAGLPLDFFVLFSSIASVLGSSGQANYAAANAFLDALAHRRRARGQAGLAIGWGPWSEGGMAARLAEPHRRRQSEQGMRQLLPEQALVALERAFEAGVAHVTAASIDWTRYARQLPAGPARTLAELGASKPAPVEAVPVSTRPELLRRLEALPSGRHYAAVLDHVREQVVRVLQLAPNHALDPDQGLKDLGLDSLMAVELRNRLQASTGRMLPTTVAFDHPTLAKLARYLASEISSLRRDVERRPAPVDHDDLGEAVEHLTEEEASRLLLEELARVRGSDHEVSNSG